MRTVEEIEDRIRGLLVEELDRRVALAHQRLPRLCVHNHQQPLDTRKGVEGAPNEGYNRITQEGKRGLPVLQTMGLCMLGSDGNPDNWKGTICEDPIDAQRCPIFHPRSSKEDLWAEFSSQIQDDEWLRENLPEVHALYWVLTSAPVIHLPWWKKVLFRFLRIQVSAPLPPFDHEKLLPSSTTR